MTLKIQQLRLNESKTATLLSLKDVFLLNVSREVESLSVKEMDATPFSSLRFCHSCIYFASVITAFAEPTCVKMIKEV